MSQLLVDDIVNKDDSGAFGASKGINVSGIATLGIASASQFEVAGVSTFHDNIRVPDDKKLHFGNTGGAFGDLQLWHDDGAHSYIRDQGSGDLRIYGSAVDIRDNAGTASVARFTDNSVHLAGITTVGILTAYDNMAVGSNIQLGNAGVVTATSFEGDGGGLTGLPAGFNWVDGSLF